MLFSIGYICLSFVGALCDGKSQIQLQISFQVQSGRSKEVKVDCMSKYGRFETNFGQFHQSERSFESIYLFRYRTLSSLSESSLRIVRFQSLRPLSFVNSDDVMFNFGTVHFESFVPSSFKPSAFSQFDRSI